MSLLLELPIQTALSRSSSPRELPMANVIIWTGLRVPVPDLWQARRAEETLEVFPSSCLSLIELGAPADSIHFRRVRRPGVPGTILADIAMARMHRRVQQGSFDLAPSVFAGVEAIETCWSDGVARIVSWFFERDGFVVETQCVEPWMRAAGCGELAVIGRWVCDHVTTVT